MIEVKPTYGVSLRICAAVLWRFLVIGTPILFLVGFLTAGAFAALGNDGANAAAWIAFLVAAILVLSFCSQLVVGQTFGRARLALVENEEESSA